MPKTSKTRKTTKKVVGTANKKNTKFSFSRGLVVSAIAGFVGAAWIIAAFAATETLTFTPDKLVSTNSCGSQPALTTDESKTVVRLPYKSDRKCAEAPMVELTSEAIQPKLVGKANSKVKVCLTMRAQGRTGKAGVRLTGTTNNTAVDVSVPRSYSTLCGVEATLIDEDHANISISNRGKQNLFISSVRYQVTSATIVPVPSAPTVAYGPVPKSAPSTSYVTPEQYGAIGDGKTDATSAMMNALSAAAGKTLWLPADKTYLISKTLSVPSNTTVAGAGKTSVLKFTWTDSSTTASGGGSNLRAKGTSATNIHLTNFVLEGGGTGVPSGLSADNPQGLVPGIRFSRVDKFSVKNIELRKTTGLGISCSACTNGTFQYNYVHNTGRDGITMYRDQSANVYNMLIDNNFIEKHGDDGIAINGLVPGQNLPANSDGSSPLPYNVNITNNILSGWETDPNGKYIGRGIALNGVNGVVVQKNKLSYPSGTGILLTGCNTSICNAMDIWWYSQNAKVLDNTIDHAVGGSRPGSIAVRVTKNSTITNNTASYSHPFDFSGCESGCSISGNTETNVVR